MTVRTKEESARIRAAYLAAYAAEEAAYAASVTGRYHAAFGGGPAFIFWHRSRDELEVLMEAALVRGRALSVKDLCEAQGIREPSGSPDIVL